MGELDYDIVQEHLLSLVPPREAELIVMEKYALDNKFPIIGPVCGYYCFQLARMINARSIFELGSGYGYSTAWFAKALRENGGGVVHHTVWEEEMSNRAAGHLSRLGSADLVKFHVAEAVQALRQEPGPFDIIFNDINKEGYPASLPVIKEKLRSGGILIIDNMLWHGRVFDKKDASPATEGVRAATREIMNDKDWIASLVPMRDGMIIGFKK